MKRLFVVFVCLLLAIAIIGGCSSQEESPEQTGAAGQPEEMADTTRMDSAMPGAADVDTTATAPAEEPPTTP
ncbi:MAG TPA: hypothetical protein VMY05_08405 [Acidobacteriota bacterium]|nr:hypothetical protein [Acidobacteriota bacterium]